MNFDRTPGARHESIRLAKANSFGAKKVAPTLIATKYSLIEPFGLAS